MAEHRISDAGKLQRAGLGRTGKSGWLPPRCGPDLRQLLADMLSFWIWTSSWLKSFA